MRRILIPLVGLLMLFVHLSPSAQYQNYDWCYTYNFTFSDYGMSLPLGTWAETTGISTEDNKLSFALTEDFYARAEVAVIRFVRGPGVSTDVSLVAVGEIFGMPVIVNQPVPINYDYLVSIPIVPLFSSAAGNAINLTLQTSGHLYLQTMTVAGNGASPFPSNHCGQSIPTHTPTPTPTATGTPDCATHDQTLFVDTTIDEWVQTAFQTSPECTYEIAIGESNGRYIDDDRPADAFYSAMLEDDYDWCEGVGANATWVKRYDFRQSDHGFSPMSNAGGTYVPGVGWNGSIFIGHGIRQNGMRLVGPQFPIHPADKSIQAFCMIYDYTPGSAQGATNHWGVMSLGNELQGPAYTRAQLIAANGEWLAPYKDSNSALDRLMVWLVAAQHGDLQPNDGYANLIAVAIAGKGIDPWTGEYDWRPSDNLIFESSPGTQMSSGWNSPRPPKNPHNYYTRYFDGNGSAWRFKISDDYHADNTGQISVRIRATTVIPPTPAATATPTPLFFQTPTPQGTTCGFETGTLLLENVEVSTDGNWAETSLVTDWNCMYGIEISEVKIGADTVTAENLIFSAHPGVTAGFLSNLGYDDEGNFTFTYVGTNHRWSFRVNENEFTEEGTFIATVYVLGPIANVGDIQDDDPLQEFNSDMVNQHRTLVASQPTGAATYTPIWHAGPIVYSTFYPTQTARAQQTLEAMYPVPNWGNPDLSPLSTQSGGLGTPEAPSGDGVVAMLGTTAAEIRELPNSMSQYVPNPNVTPLMGHVKWTLSCSSIYEILGTNWGAMACHATVGVVLIVITTTVFLTLRSVIIIFRFAVWIFGKILKVIPMMG